MYCSVFVFLLCLFMFSGTTVSTKRKGFNIDGYNLSNVKKENKTHIFYEYKNNELLNITCHEASKPPMILKWLKNGQFIHGTKPDINQINLQLPINKSNDKDRLTCHASEDQIGLVNNAKNISREINIILSYDVHEDSTTTKIGTNNLDDKKKKPEETWLEKLMKNKLFLIVAVVVIIVIILSAILGFASKNSYRIKEDKVGLQCPISSASSATYLNSDSRTLPIPPHRMTNDKVRMHPASSAPYFNSTSRTLPIPPHRMTNVKVGMHSPISSSSYYNTGPRKPTTQHNLPEECFYTNYDYNQTHLNGSREVIDEYQEPMDSQAYSYVQSQMYSEPEKQFYTEPIPKILRKPKDIAYVNYNKSNGSANINKNIDEYQNCNDICDNDFDYYTKPS